MGGRREDFQGRLAALSLLLGEGCSRIYFYIKGGGGEGGEGQTTTFSACHFVHCACFMCSSESGRRFHRTCGLTNVLHLSLLPHPLALNSSPSARFRISSCLGSCLPWVRCGKQAAASLLCLVRRMEATPASWR